MRNTSKTLFAQAAGSLLGAALMTGAAMARAPGVLATIPSGASMGVPIAALVPVAGLAASSRTGAVADCRRGDASPHGPGLSVTKHDGPMNVRAMRTQDLSARISGDGDRVWLNAVIPLTRFGQ